MKARQWRTNPSGIETICSRLSMPSTISGGAGIRAAARLDHCTGATQWVLGSQVLRPRGLPEARGQSENGDGPKLLSPSKPHGHGFGFGISQ